MAGKDGDVLHHDFYTAERWNNWINQVKESDFKFDESDEPQGKEGAIFVNMEDDIVLACLKIIAKCEKKKVSPESALEYVAQIRDVALAEIDPISEDADMMVDSLQASLMGGFAACEAYLNGDYDNSVDIADLVKVAIEAEASDDIEIALGAVAEIGALVISGKELTEKVMEEVPYGLVAEWLDGIDSIAAAMVGSDSYKDDEADDGKN